MLPEEESVADSHKNQQDQKNRNGQDDQGPHIVSDAKTTPLQLDKHSSRVDNSCDKKPTSIATKRQRQQPAFAIRDAQELLAYQGQR